MSEATRHVMSNTILLLLCVVAISGGVADWRAKYTANKQVEKSVADQLGPVKPVEVLQELKRLGNVTAILSFMEDSEDAIIAVDKTGNVIAWSRGATKMTGVSEQEAVGYGLAHILPENLRAQHLSAFRSAMQSPHVRSRTTHGTCITKNGEIQVIIKTHTIPGSMALARILPN